MQADAKRLQAAAPDRSDLLSQPWQAKQRVENLLRDTLKALFGYLPTERLIDPDSYQCSLEKVEQGLTRLTDEEHDAVMMFRSGYPCAQIATELNTSVESVRAHLRRGLSTLKMSATDPNRSHRP